MNEMNARETDIIAAPRNLSADSTLKKKKVTAETASKIADKIRKILRNMLSSFLASTHCVNLCGVMQRIHRRRGDAVHRPVLKIG